MRGSRWILIDALHPLFHYLQAAASLFPHPQTPKWSSAAATKTNAGEPRIASGASAMKGWLVLRSEDGVTMGVAARGRTPPHGRRTLLKIKKKKSVRWGEKLRS